MTNYVYTCHNKLNAILFVIAIYIFEPIFHILQPNKFDRKWYKNGNQTASKFKFISDWRCQVWVMSLITVLSNTDLAVFPHLKF